MFAALIGFIACSKEEAQVATSNSGAKLGEVMMPADFSFSSYRSVHLKFEDAPNVIYRIYALYQNERDFISSGTSLSGTYERMLQLGSHYTQIEIERNTPWGTGRKFFNIGAKNEDLIHDFKTFGKVAGSEPEDVLYAINNAGDFYTIDLLDGNYTEDHSVANPIGGSIANAVDTVNEIMYYFRSRNLYKYDITNDVHSLVANYPVSFPLGSSFPRLEFDHATGHLFGSNNTSLYEFVPATGAIVNTYTIQGFVNSSSGGDLAFTDGRKFLAAFSGLYEITNLNSGTGIATIIRLSAENLPFQLTSLGYDRNGYLYACTNNNPSKLVKIDPVDGSYAIVKTMSTLVNDLGSVVSRGNSICTVDTDGDGVCDELDAAPLDPSIAFEEWIPSLLGNGSLAFEDNWPAYGDYDFNDLVIKYKYKKQLDASNVLVRMIGYYEVTAVGASYDNGFGFQLDVNPAVISSVTGFVHGKGIVSVDGKGLEVGQSIPTIILFEDARDVIDQPVGAYFINTQIGKPYSKGDEIVITFEYNQAALRSGVYGTSMDLTNALPGNAFIFQDGVRSHEIHLADGAPTDLMNMDLFGDLDDNSIPGAGRYFRDAMNVPWAINIAHVFRHPQERIRIDNSYNFFVAWGSSNGLNYPDWYKDNNGYRKADSLYFSPEEL